MLTNFLTVVRLILSGLFIILNILIFTLPLFLTAFLKFLIPLKGWRTLASRLIVGISNSWIRGNNLIIQLFTTIEWDLPNVDGLSLDKTYLLTSNHQSWVDIVILQKIFLNKIPFLRFFLKQQLIWVPIMGMAWWALDFPFMKRHSKTYLQKHPEKANQDLEATKKFCEKFKSTPITVMSFIEGTRFTKKKQSKQESQYNHLLKPRAGGMAYVFQAMGESIDKIIDVTIYYPNGIPSMVDLMCNRIPKIVVKLTVLEVPEAAFGQYFSNPNHTEKFQSWVNSLWNEKDKTLAQLVEQERLLLG